MKPERCWHCGGTDFYPRSRIHPVALTFCLIGLFSSLLSIAIGTALGHLGAAIGGLFGVVLSLVWLVWTERKIVCSDCRNPR